MICEQAVRRRERADHKETRAMKRRRRRCAAQKQDAERAPGRHRAPTEPPRRLLSQPVLQLRAHGRAARLYTHRLLTDALPSAQSRGRAHAQSKQRMPKRQTYCHVIPCERSTRLLWRLVNKDADGLGAALASCSGDLSGQAEIFHAALRVGPQDHADQVGARARGLRQAGTRASAAALRPAAATHGAAAQRTCSASSGRVTPQTLICAARRGGIVSAWRVRRVAEAHARAVSRVKQR